MSDDKRSPSRVGKPLVFGEVIISEDIFAQYMKRAMNEGRTVAVEAAVKMIETYGGAFSGGPSNNPEVARALGVFSIELIRAVRTLLPDDSSSSQTSKEPK